MDCVVLPNLTAERSDVAGITAAVLEERVNSHIRFFWGVTAILFGGLVAGAWMLADIRGDVKVLMLPQKLAQSSQNPDNPKDQGDARKIVATARAKFAALPQSIVQKSGIRFTEAAAKDNGAWPVAVELVSYRTISNSDLLLVGTAEQIATTPGFNEGPSARFFNAPPGYPSPAFTYGGSVSPDRAALMGLVGPGNPDNLGYPPPGPGLSKQVILGEGGAILLDGMILRHVVLRKTAVFYNGGLTKLEDVIFVDCSFVLKNDPVARLFALSVLSQSQVMFLSPLKQ